VPSSRGGAFVAAAGSVQRAMRVAISGGRDPQHTGIEGRKFGGVANPPGAIVPIERYAEAARVGGEFPVPPGDIASKADDVRQDWIRHVAREVGQGKHRAVHTRMLPGLRASVVAHWQQLSLSAAALLASRTAPVSSHQNVMKAGRVRRWIL
jgi:hypothetical protein